MMTKTKKISFVNKNGENLTARLDLPVNGHPIAYALFAHCFTCSKNLTAVKNISRALNQKGIAVLRFDFTGLGESEGDFANTNFSSNVEDLVVAANYLKENYIAPQIIIGHSLGGAAVIFAAKQLPSIKAIATIGAPASPEHVSHLFKHGLDKIEQDGKATLEIGGRPFTIKKQFLDDLKSKNLASVLKNIEKALLVMHSPQDNTVGIENAAEIYQAAMHPKSFISLDGADHLLMNKEDSNYVGEIIASWSLRYIDIPKKEALKTDKEVVARLNDSYTTEIMANGHSLLVDEPTDIGGNDLGPNPYGLVSSGLAACTAITLKMYANKKEWDINEIRVHIKHDKVEQTKEDETNKVDQFVRYIEIEGNIDEEQRNRLLLIANKCPVHKTLHSDVIVETKLI